jgi:hypothetical protein
LPDIQKLRLIPPPKYIFNTIGIDHLGLFITTDGGKWYFVVCIDYLSRYMEAKPTVSTGVEEVMTFLEEALFFFVIERRSASFPIKAHA